MDTENLKKIVLIDNSSSSSSTSESTSTSSASSVPEKKRSKIEELRGSTKYMVEKKLKAELAKNSKALTGASGKTAFSDAYMNQFKGKMSEEMLENFRKQGESYYHNMNINEESGELENLIVLKVFEMTEALKSGLDPKCFTREEIDTLRFNLGETWYEKYGYTKDDLPEFKD